ncbi:pyrimidine/purine nucleoside phosphorylase [Anaeromyxobacter paludicola]|uniref:Pyrimidine/purine nucleoside phosphorylase n=1 Tax=Anaeromyxobacter paludicola TaxID=2918171 RepID=A0ABN6NC53_9BACT|nr:pyrimidine/purine nucleoside phosphorylase [Anaeromyxobacter paludicola]BDG09532.1 UPF0345 protein [Anaeromyxobacter paludicola]
MLKHNVYFDGLVQSLGYERLGQRQTIGVISPGEFHFGTDAAERVTLVSGELFVRPPGEASWQLYPAGTTFEVAGKSGFDVKALGPVAYLCEYL